MAFRFRMQKILDYREQLEEEAKVRLADAEQRHEAARRHHEKVLALLTQAKEQALREPAKNAAEFWISEHYMKGLQKDLDNAAMQLQMTKEIRNEARRILAERAMDKKMLARLKERQKAAWNHDEMLKEQHFNDEIATIRYKASAF
ncbi:MAG: flagellar export protein FliJ [Desulfovibrio sp.]|nr:flagellar export protein FliJ [Desulfovibrio sp.]